MDFSQFTTTETKPVVKTKKTTTRKTATKTTPAKESVSHFIRESPQTDYHLHKNIYQGCEGSCNTETRHILRRRERTIECTKCGHTYKPTVREKSIV